MDDLTDAQIEAMADKCPGITRHSYILGAKDARAALSTSPAPTQAQAVPESPMKKMAQVLRAKAAAERDAFDKRVQSGEWGQECPQCGFVCNTLPELVKQ